MIQDIVLVQKTSLIFTYLLYNSSLHFLNLGIMYRVKFSYLKCTVCCFVKFVYLHIPHFHQIVGYYQQPFHTVSVPLKSNQLCFLLL